MNDQIPKLLRDLIYAEQYHLLDTPFGHAVRTNIQYGVADCFVRNYVSRLVHTHRVQNAFCPFPATMRMSGDFMIGFDLHGRPIRCPTQYLNEPSLTVGSTGSGKTTKSRFWSLQAALTKRHLGLFLFDFRKREMRVLSPYLRRAGVNLLVVPARSLRLNPLQVCAHTDHREWAANLAETLVRVLSLPQRAAKLLYSTISRLYAFVGVVDGREEYPTLFDLREAVVADVTANAQARQAVVDSLDPILFSLRDVLCYRRGWTPDDLAQRQIVFEFSGLTDPEKDLLLNTIVLGIFLSGISRGISNPEMDLYLNCDEAARLVGSQRQQYFGSHQCGPWDGDWSRSESAEHPTEQVSAQQHAQQVHRSRIQSCGPGDHRILNGAESRSATLDHGESDSRYVRRSAGTRRVAQTVYLSNSENGLYESRPRDSGRKR